MSDCADEGTRTLNPAKEHAPKACAYTNSATSACTKAQLSYPIRASLSMCYTIFMKRSLLLTICVLLAGCQLTVGNSSTNTSTAVNQTYWLNYYPTQCNETPWGDTLDEREISDYYQNALGVTVEAVEVNPPAVGFIACAACGCGTGTQVSVQTDTAGRDILLEHGFTEEAVTEDWPQDSDTNTDSVENSNLNLNTNTEVNANINVNVEEEVKVSETEVSDLPEMTPEDTDLQTRAETVQAALASYYSSHGAYPDTLEALQLTTSLTGLTYTPIGVTPADYYDLSVEYSTGSTVVNP